MTRRERARLGELFAPRQNGWQDVLVALAVAVAYAVLCLATLERLGYARDEGFYFEAARRYGAWLELLGRSPRQAIAEVDAYWRFNSEHPALMKTLFALSHHFLFEKWRLFAMEGTSFRFPAIVVSALGVGLVYLWGARAHGRFAGAVAAASFGFMPRFFFHAHLACFDAPIAAMWLLCAYTWWRALARGGVLRFVAVGVAFGLALETKHNSWFLPFACVAHAGVLALPGAGRGLERGVVLRRAAAALASMAALGPLVFWGLWPWIWHDTAARLEAYARFHLEHVYYNMELFGRNYFEPPMPRSYAWVMTAATVPAVTLFAFVFGLGVAARAALGWGALHSPRLAHWRAKRDHSAAAIDPATLALWILGVAVNYAAWLRASTPIFGGTKHWMTAYPFLALVAGAGVATAARLVHLHARRRRRALDPRALAVALGACVIGAPIAQTLHAHPWGLTAYTPLVGGAAGAASLGLNRGFWGYTTGAVAPYLDQRVPRRGRVYIHDTAWPAWEMLIRDGRVRRDIQGVGNVAQADFAIYHHELHMLGQEYQAQVAFGTVAPDHVDGLDGVPVIWVYRRP